MVGTLLDSIKNAEQNAEQGKHVMFVVPCESVAKDVSHRMIRAGMINSGGWEHFSIRIDGVWDRYLHLESGGMIDLVVVGQEKTLGLIEFEEILHPGILPE
jgi:hypothetical protein